MPRPPSVKRVNARVRTMPDRPMTQSMIERVARAILQCDIGTGEPLVCQLAFIIDDPKLSAAIIARAAIEAMHPRRYEGGTIDGATFDACYFENCTVTGETFPNCYFVDTKTGLKMRNPPAAIDAALKEGE